MKIKDQIKYATIDREGNVCGPVGDDKEIIKNTMIIGFINAIGVGNNLTKEEIWTEVRNSGFSIKKVKISEFVDGED